MLQIRHRIFETNSSSANVLVIPKNQGVRVPERFIFMDDDTSLRPVEIVLCHLGHDSETVDQIVNFLYLSGVDEIIYGGHDINYKKAIDKYKKCPEDKGIPKGWGKESFAKALFGTETDCDHYNDGDRRPNYVEGAGTVDSDDDNWYREYYAD